MEKRTPVVVLFPNVLLRTAYRHFSFTFLQNVSERTIRPSHWQTRLLHTDISFNALFVFFPFPTPADALSRPWRTPGPTSMLNPFSVAVSVQFFNRAPVPLRPRCRISIPVSLVELHFWYQDRLRRAAELRYRSYIDYNILPAG